MGSTHSSFWKKLIHVRVTHNGRYLLKKDIKLKDIKTFHILRDIGYLVFVQVEPLVLQ